MSEDNVEHEELESTDGEPLPDREALSLWPRPDPIGSGFTLPVEPPAES